MDQLDLNELNTLRYIAGTTIHKITQELKEFVERKVITKVHQAKIDYRCLQLSKKLILPQGFNFSCVKNPETLNEIARKQNACQSLKIVTDDTFEFFKTLFCKVKVLQTYKSLKRNPVNVRQHTILKLMQDIKLVEIWCNLFASNSCQQCKSNESAESDNVDSDEEDEDDFHCYQSESEEILDYEMEQSLVMQLLEKVIIYITSVHLSDLIGTYKDKKLDVKKSLSIRQSRYSFEKSDVIQKEIPFPCGFCGKECIDVEAMKSPKLEDFSVLCDKCDKWYHYVCLGLSRKEPELKQDVIYLFTAVIVKTTQICPLLMIHVH